MYNLASKDRESDYSRQGTAVCIREASLQSALEERFESKRWHSTQLA